MAKLARSAPHPRLEVSYRRIDTLTLDPHNPRLHDRKQVAQIANSIKTFGFNVPVLVDKNGKVIAGHGRILAAQLLGLEEVPTVCLEHLTEHQARAFLLADNRLSENSAWDDRLLGEQLKALSDADLDFSLEVTGFEVGEIDLLIEGLTAAPDGADDPADVLPDMTAQPVSKPGDIWSLGPHSIYCGNALTEASYAVLMSGKKADLVFVDPPFNVRIDGHATGLGAVRHREFAMAAGEMDETEFIAFLTQACRLLARFSTDGALHFICIDWGHIFELLSAGRAVYQELKNMCVWAKDNAGMGSLYRSQHELVFVFKHGSASHRNNIQLGKHGRYRSNVWRYAGMNSIGRTTDEGNLLALHPTVKPVALVADAILDCCKRGDIVLDAFLGSGTTLMAAERVGRICHGMEIDPRYVDTAIRRWQKWTGQRARHARTNRYFDTLASKIGGRHG